MTAVTAHIDHLVVHAATLEQGAAWCERLLGAAPLPGGAHPLMGTHNRLLSLGHGVYLEIIAIDPDAPAPPHPRWFAMDDAARQREVQREPRLVHFVVRTPDIAAALRASAYDLGAARAASRGKLQWQISLRDDGALHEAGLIPTLIEWRGAHPSDSLLPSGWSLQSLCFAHPQYERIAAAHRALGLQSSEIALRYETSALPRLVALLMHVDGRKVELRS